MKGGTKSSMSRQMAFPSGFAARKASRSAKAALLCPRPLGGVDQRLRFSSYASPLKRSPSVTFGAALRSFSTFMAARMESRICSCV